MEDGTKSVHTVTINEYGSKQAETTFGGITTLPVPGMPIPIAGVGILTANVSGTHPHFTIAFSGSAFSVPLVVGGLVAGLPTSSLIIDYAVDVHLNFCLRTGTV